jgi:alpha-galactosidase
MMKDGRDSNGHLIPNYTRFPDGINGLADKIHEMGLKLGIYSCKQQPSSLLALLTQSGAGSKTCAGYPASLEHEDVDASDFAAWEVDCAFLLLRFTVTYFARPQIRQLQHTK